MASYPGPGYTRRLGYDEEKHLLSISRDYGGGNVQTAYQYAYGADGGRRWRKDLANDVWTWYPCGVVCCAGELVETQSDLTGSSWTVSAQYLRGLKVVRRNGDFHHPDMLGVYSVITNANAAITSRNLYDNFGQTDYTSGSVQTPVRYGQVEDEGLVKLGVKDRVTARALSVQQRVTALWLPGFPIPYPPNFPPIPIPPIHFPPFHWPKPPTIKPCSDFDSKMCEISCDVSACLMIGNATLCIGCIGHTQPVQ